jgi:hypothetical protein
MEVGEGCKLSREDIIVVHFPCGTDAVELRPAFDGLFEGLDFGGVRHLLAETVERLVMVDVIRYMVVKVFEVSEGTFEVGFDRDDVL